MTELERSDSRTYRWDTKKIDGFIEKGDYSELIAMASRLANMATAKGGDESDYKRGARYIDAYMKAGVM